ATLQRLANALVHRLDEFLRDRSTGDVIDELVAFTRLVRFEDDLGVTVLALAAGLANVLAFRLGALANSLAIRHLRLTDIGLNLVFAHHAINDDLQMQLAHAGDDGLPAVNVSVDLESGIFLRQL